MFGWFKNRRKLQGPDYSEVDSQEKAVAMFQRGELEKLLLRPAEFGGEDHALNILYVPLGFAAAKAWADINVIGPMAAEGKVTKYRAIPEYQGNSVIPIAIKIVASDPGEVEETIIIWGQALSRENNSKHGARSLDELKAAFLRHYSKTAVDSMMDLFYLPGASKQVVDLYRHGVPRAQELTITSADVIDISKDRQPSTAHTLEPEKLLLLKFSRANQEGIFATEQYFYIGHKKDRYYFTLPTGG